MPRATWFPRSNASIAYGVLVYWIFLDWTVVGITAGAVLACLAGLWTRWRVDRRKLREAIGELRSIPASNED